ncbi:MAG: large conductance mechanosensitive channel protein MscL [Clostridiales bacterium]|nr:large conductance mechanosensitive channel protein MscL [Clostridiales bacterium]
MKKLLGEFKKFALKGNVIDMAVGVMVGGAFSKIVTSVVNDLFMPVLSLLTGGLDTSEMFVALGKTADGVTPTTLEAAKEAGIATLNYGTFIQTVIDFLLIAICIFFFVKLVTKLHKKETSAPAPAPAPRLCPFCCQPVDKKATRCHHCTSELPAEEAK